MVVPDAGDAWTEAGLTAAVYRHFADRYVVIAQVQAPDLAERAAYAEWSEALRLWHVGGRKGDRPPAYVFGPSVRRIDVCYGSPVTESRSSSR